MLFASGGSAEPPTKERADKNTKTFTLPATTTADAPLDTGITAPKKGLVVKCSGTIPGAPGSPDQPCSTTGAPSSDYPVPGGTIVVARMGSGAYQSVGSGTTIKGNGTLQLAINDCTTASCQADNSGSFKIKVSGGPDTVTLSGMVYGQQCINAIVGQCYQEMLPLGGAVVQATGQPTATEGPSQYTVTSSSNGMWSMKVRPGVYAITADEGSTTPEVRNVDATGTRRGLDFCPAAGGEWVGRCDPQTLRGKLQDDEGGPYSPALVSWGMVNEAGFNYGDADRVEGSKGKFELLVPERARVVVRAQSVTETFGEILGPLSFTSDRFGVGEDPLLTLMPDNTLGFSSPSRFETNLDGLPFRPDRDFTLELTLERKPSANESCTAKKKVRFDAGKDNDILPFMDDVAYSRHQAHVAVYSGLDFCPGSYEMQVRTAGGKNVTIDFTSLSPTR